MDQLSDLDVADTLSAAEAALRTRRQSEVDDLELATHWADLHATDPADAPGPRGRDRRRGGRRGGPKLIQSGGQGTPRVQDLCLAELATSRQCHPMAVRSLVADALDLRHRLPKVRGVMMLLACEPWVARRIASMTRHLTLEEAGYVDAAVAAALAGEQPSVLLGLCEAKIIEANPARHQARLDEQARREYVALGRMNPEGLRHIIAQLNAGTAMHFDAMLTRIADILAVRDRAAGAEPRDRDQRRAAAFAILGRPAEALRLLLEHATDPDLGPESNGDADEPDNPDPDGDSVDDGDSDSDRVNDGDNPGGAADDLEDRGGEGPDGGSGDQHGDQHGDPHGAPHGAPARRQYGPDDVDLFAPGAEPDPEPGHPGAPDPGPMPTPTNDDDADADAAAGEGGDAGAGTASAPEPPEPPDAGPPPPSDPEHPTPGEPAPGTPGAEWVTGFPHHLLHALQAIDPAALRPRAVLYVHLHHAALTTSAPTGRGTIAKVEDAGPYLPTNLPNLLGNALVKVTEVIDLNGHTPLATYVHPQWLKEQAQLISPRTCFPHSTSVTRNVDYDHPEPYQPPGTDTGSGPEGGSEGSATAVAPPGQTGLHNTGPLGRYQHRVKTFAGWTVREPQPGTYVWRTPHHRYRLVEDTGTRLLDEQAGRALFTPPAPAPTPGNGTGTGTSDSDSDPGSDPGSGRAEHDGAEHDGDRSPQDSTPTRRPHPRDAIRPPDEASDPLELAVARALHDRINELAEQARIKRILHAARHTTHTYSPSGLGAHLTQLPDLTLAIADDYKHTT